MSGCGCGWGWVAVGREQGNILRNFSDCPQGNLNVVLGCPWGV